MPNEKSGRIDPALTTLRVGFIGIGNMGMPMAKSLVKAGFPLRVFDLDQKAVAEITAWGASSAGSPYEIARDSDSVITMVRDEAQTDQVIFGQKGLWKGMKKDSTLIMSSTLSPQYCRKIYDITKARQIKVIDAPVSDPSGPQHIPGGLTIMVGGDKEAVERHRPIFQAMGKNIFHLGPIGNGQICKLVNQINAFNIGIVTRESLNLGLKAGLDLKTMVEALSLGRGSTRGLENMAETLRNYEFSSASHPSALKQAQANMRPRDRELALELAGEVGAEAPIAGCISHLDVESVYKDYLMAIKKYSL
jgi:3-hydroxyisobutyrate dehydrogenase-like beta-hydroxyacid dehydrogenase